MKTKWYLFFGGVMLFSSSAMAATVTCQSVLTGVGSFTQLEAVNATGGCDIGNVNFSAFNFTTTSGGFGAADIYVSLAGGASTPFGQVLGLSYSGNGGVLPGGETVGYTATFDPNAGVACPVNYTCGIIGGESQLTSIYGNGAIVTTVDSGGYAGTNQVDSVSNTDETHQFTFPMIVPPNSLTKEATYNGVGTITNFSTQVIAGEVDNAPEPATFSLIGFALLMLSIGAFRRNRPIAPVHAPSAALRS